MPILAKMQEWGTLIRGGAWGVQSAGHPAPTFQ